MQDLTGGSSGRSARRNARLGSLPGVITGFMALIWALLAALRFTWVASSGCEDYEIACHSAHPVRAGIGLAVATFGVLALSGVTMMCFLPHLYARHPKLFNRSAALAVTTAYVWVFMLLLDY